MLGPPKLKSEPTALPRAVLFTDIVGSTKYFATRGDEAGLRMLDWHNRALFPVIEDANGRIIKTIGDSIFAVFDQPAAALQAAWGLQRRMEELRASVSAEEAIHIRVGVHYGLVTERDNDVFGDAVNLAERVKSKAEADQVFVSRTLRDMVRARPQFVFQSAGPHELKGAAEPMELFRLTGAPALPRLSRWRKSAKRSGRVLRRRLPFVAGALVVLVAAAALLLFRRGPHFPRRAVAVFPFRNVRGDAKLNYLSLALPRELAAQLSRNQSLTVRPFPSVERYVERYKDWQLSQAAREFQAGTLVEGNYLWAGEQVRVEVDIYDPWGDRQLWSESFEGAPEKTLELMKQMASAVVQGFSQLVLGAAKTGAPSVALDTGKPQTSPLGTDNWEAYDLYLRGLVSQLQATARSNLDAIDTLQRAVSLDGNFARAHSLLAQAYTAQFWDFSNDTRWLDKAEAEARRALELDARLPDAHYALAHALEGKGRRYRLDSMRENLASVVADPHYVPALTYLARYFFYMGDYDRALRTLDRISEIDPTEHIHHRKAVYLYFAGHLDEGRAENRMAEQQAGNGTEELTIIGITYVWLNDFRSAERMLRRLEQIPGSELNPAEIRAWLYNARGQIPQSQGQMQVLSPRGEVGWGIAQYLATLYALQGDRERALDWLEKAIRLGAPNYGWFSSRDFRLLRGDPRYEAALKTLAEEYRPLHEEFDRAFTEIQR